MAEVERVITTETRQVRIVVGQERGEHKLWFYIPLKESDKSASIRFLRPGRGVFTATFHIPRARVDEIRTAADSGEKVEPVFTAEVLDAEGQAVARVEKTLYVRRKDME